MAVHHRRRGGQVQQVSLVHYFKPLVHARLGRRYAFADVGVEYLGSGSGQGVETCGHEPLQCLHCRERTYACDVGYLWCPERMQPERRVAALQFAEQLFVKFYSQLRVQAALYQELVAAEPQCLVDLLAVLFYGRYECTLGLVRFAVEIAELAPRYADIGYVDVAVYLPCHCRGVVDRLSAETVCRFGQLGSGAS